MPFKSRNKTFRFMDGAAMKSSSLRFQYAGFADCRIPAENEYLQRCLSGWICYQCMYLSGIYRKGHYEASDAAESRTYASEETAPGFAVPVFDSTVPKNGMGDYFQ